MTQGEGQVPYANKGIGSKPYEKKKRKCTSRANPHPTIEEREGHSCKEEADIDYNDGLEALRKYKDSGLTYHLRQAGIRLKMAAERYDRSVHLLGHTLEPYIEEEKK